MQKAWYSFPFGLAPDGSMGPRLSGWNWLIEEPSYNSLDFYFFLSLLNFINGQVDFWGIPDLW